MNRSKLIIAGAILFCSILSAACATAGPRMRDRHGSYSVEVLVGGTKVPLYHHRGESYVLGKLGRRYTLRIRNRSNRRIEAVVTVDGRDVLDGKPGHLRKRGYLVPAWGTVEIEGWRLSHADVAAFRFSSVKNSYASRTGSARNVGVIGVAIFREKLPPPPPPPVYAPDNRSENDDWDYGEDSIDSLSSSSGAERKGAPAPRAQSNKAEGEQRATSQPHNRTMRSKSRRRSRSRAGLGTAFGERRYSPIHEVTFEREHATRPTTVLGLRYNDRRGLIALGVDLDQWKRRRERRLRLSATPFPAAHGHYATPPAGWND